VQLLFDVRFIENRDGEADAARAQSFLARGEHEVLGSEPAVRFRVRTERLATDDDERAGAIMGKLLSAADVLDAREATRAVFCGTCIDGGGDRNA
jgi:hypothetical protein